MFRVLHCAAFAALALAGSAACAADGYFEERAIQGHGLQESVQRGFAYTKAAFIRQQNAALSFAIANNLPSTHLPESLSALTPAWGFSPSVQAGLSWSLVPNYSNHTVTLCAFYTADTAELRNSFLLGAQRRKAGVNQGGACGGPVGITSSLPSALVASLVLNGVAAPPPEAEAVDGESATPAETPAP